MMLQRLNSRRRSGFTLLEILIVVAIIVVVAGVGGVYLFGALDKGKADAAKAQMKALETAIEMYRLNNTNPPGSLELLLQADVNNGGVPYLKDSKAIIDPWGAMYIYNYDGPAGPTLSCRIPSNGMVISNQVQN